MPTDQSTLFNELCDASSRLQHHLGWAENTLCLPRRITQPFGKAVMGLAYCDFDHSSGFYAPSKNGAKAIIIAESMSQILPNKIGISAILDLIAIPLATLDRWFVRTGRVLILGLENLYHIGEHVEIFVHRTPFDWLQKGGGGICLLNQETSSTQGTLGRRKVVNG